MTKLELFNRLQASCLSGGSPQGKYKLVYVTRAGRTYVRYTNYDLTYNAIKSIHTGIVALQCYRRWIKQGERVK